MFLTLKNTLQLLLPSERKKFFLFAGADMLVTLLDILLLVLLLGLVDFYLHQGHSSSAIFQQLFSGNHTVVAAILLLLLFIAKNAAAYIITAAQYRYVYAVASRLSEKKCLQFLQGTYRDYVRTDASVYIKQISYQPVEFAHYVLNGWQQVITQLLLLVFTATAICIYSPLVFLLQLLLLAPPVILIAVYTRKKISAIRGVVKTSGEKSIQYLKEALAGFVESKLYGKEQFFTKRYASRQQQLNGHLAQLQSVQAMPSRLMELAMVTGFVLLVTASAVSTRFSLPFFAVGAFMAAAYKIVPGAVKIMNHATLIKTYSYTLQDLGGDVTQLQQPGKPVTKIEVKNISFGYGKKLLDQFSCCLMPGDFAGINAASGRGKTTLVNLLLGFEETQTGQIFFNDKSVTAAERQQYKTAFAYVKQQPFLVYDSVQNNITLSDTAIDEKRLQDAVAATGIDEWLAGSGQNLQFVVTENGRNISGGQRQRIALARALYKNAAVIILDEPFSELDNASEKKMLQHFSRLAAAGKTVMLITHNKESLSYCNKIIWAGE